MADPARGAPRRDPLGGRCARRRRARRSSRPSSARRSPSWATTRPTRRCCSPRPAASRRARSPSGCATSSERALGERAERVEVAGPGFLNVFLADRWHRDASRRCSMPGEDFGRATQPATRAGPGRVRVRQPDRPADGRRAAGAPPTATRWRGCSSSPGTGSSASTTSTTPAARCDRSPSRSRPHARRRAARGRLSRRVRRRARRRAGRRRGAIRPTSTSWRGAAPRSMRDRIEATLDRFGVRFDTWFSERSLHEAGGSSGDRPSCASAATSTRARARSGCAPPSSATTRTGS